jgi:hypothetical protein
MGRPIKSKFFGNRANPYDNAQTGGATGVGGEGIATITTATQGTLYSTSTSLNITFSNPQIKGGVKPTATIATDANGNTVGVTLLTAGTGYTSAPTATLPVTTGTTATFTIALTAAVQNALAFTSYLTTGSNAVAGGDILKQEASRRYLVSNSEGVGQVRLVASDTLAAGQMNLIATDGSGATFFVTKLTARKATIVNRTSTSTAVVTGATAGWTLAAATGTNQVTLASN